LRTHAQLEALIPRIPLGRLGVADDNVGAILFLASGASQFITGQNVEVNGGFWVI
jgi:3-oxoacyl-[acyl-carrier protein] reductase